MTPCLKQHLGSFRNEILFRWILIMELFISAEGDAQCTSVTMSLSDPFLDGKTLSGHVYYQIGSIPNVQLCAKRCLLHRKCRSINYNSLSGLCELNSEDHLSQPASLSLSSFLTSQYYSISGWPEIILGQCQGHACPDTQMCEVNVTKYFCVDFQVADVTPVSPLTSPVLPTYTVGCTNVLPPISVVSYNNATFQYRPLWCMHSNPNVLQNLLQNLRPFIDWLDMLPTIIECAKLSHMAGYPYFGIEFFGECWADTAFVESSHVKIQAEECETKTYQGTGGANHMCVYEII